MKIGIDAHMIGEHETGNERFIYGVIQGLKELSNGQHEYHIFIQERYLDLISNQVTEVFFIHFVSANTIYRNAIQIPYYTRSLNLDVYFATYTAPLFSACPVVIAIHDISFVHFPEYFPKKVLYMLNQIIPRSLRFASHITTISEYTKQDIIEQYNVPSEKITVTYLSTSNKFKPKDPVSARQHIQAIYPYNEPFILAVGNLQRRKNLGRLVDAYVQLRSQNSIPHKLVIVGKALWHSDEIFTKVSETKLHDEIVFTGYISDDDLVNFYNAADLFVYPSIFEGFGLPVLEAMRCGILTLTSNVSSMPEIISDERFLFDPFDVENIETSISYALSLDKISKNRFTRDMVKISHRFSWKKSATILLRVFEDVVRQE